MAQPCHSSATGLFHYILTGLESATRRYCLDILNHSWKYFPSCSFVCFNSLWLDTPVPTWPPISPSFFSTEKTLS